jgi:trehalose 6-phosphate phosphatase
MSTTATFRRENSFFVRLSQCKKSTLLLDYDGTLAPFRPERDLALPYPQVPELLERIGVVGNTRTVIISGRPAREIPPLLGMHVAPEIWGSHGLERLHSDGSYEVAEIDLDVTAALALAGETLDQAGLGRHLEWKPGSLAIHWRGFHSDEVAEIRTRAVRAMQPIASAAGLRLSSFDGGVEMRVAAPNKAHAVKTILQESGDPAMAAYLGDDMTDEDAFGALDPFGLSVLVREEYRPTSAKVWLRPPEELLAFLEQWLYACGGDV